MRHERADGAVQQQFPQCQLVAEGQGGLAAVPLSPSSLLHGHPPLSSQPLQNRRLCGVTKLLILLHHCPVGLGGMSSIPFSPLVLSLLIVFSPF